MRQLLWVLLAVDVLQLASALAAGFVGAGRARRGRRADDGAFHLSLARYSFGRAGLLALGACVLAVPVVLGLAHALDETTAVVIAIVLELVAVPLGRAGLAGLERGHRDRVSGLRA